MSDLNKKYTVDVEFETNTKEVEKGVKRVDKAVQDTTDSTKKAKKGFGGLKTAINGVGMALKAAGIGLLITGLTAIFSLIQKNQKVLDFFSTVTNTIGLAFKALSDAVGSAYERVKEATGGFDALGAVVRNVIKLALTPLKLSFFNLKLAAQGLKLAWENIFGDEEGVKKAKKNLEETKQAIRDTLDEGVKAAVGIGKNIGEAIDEVAMLGSAVAENISKIEPKKIVEAAKAMTDLGNQAQIAGAKLNILKEQYDRQAEQLRQIRDDELRSIDERKQANEDLLKVLEEQEKAMVKQAELRIAEAQSQYDLNSTTENYVALLEAQAEKLAVLAQVEGFRSEQKMNLLGLTREEIELNNLKAEGDLERQQAQLEFEAELEQDEIAKLEKKREALDIENELLLSDIERKREIYMEGTLAREEAEQEFLTRQQEINNQRIALEAETEKKIKENKVKEDGEKAKSEKQLHDHKKMMAQAGIALLGKFAAEGSVIGKGAAVGQAIMTTYQGINKAMAETTDFTPTQSLRFANAAAVGLAGFANVKKILSTDAKKGGSAASGASVAAASFGAGSQVVDSNFQSTGNSETAQLTQALNNQTQQPVRAYVTSGEVRTAAAQERRRIEDAGF